MSKNFKPSFLICSGFYATSLFSSNAWAEKALNDALVSKTFDVMLANDYQPDLTLTDYWYSEKLDGVRAIWTGQQFISRNGHPIYAPEWFIQQLPDQVLDGELWAGRGQFNKVQNTVLDEAPNDADWQDVVFMVFDKPQPNLAFEQRYWQLEKLVNQINSPYLKLVTHRAIESDIALSVLLSQVEEKKGEGLMLRNKNSLYQSGRSDDLVKLKSYQDSEATVIGYKPGNGKYAGLTGSLLVKWHNGQTFYIGSGLSDQDRAEPPALGATVTFRYNGLTHSGIPRFARFSHVRIEN